MNQAPDKPRLVLYGIGHYGQMMVRFAHRRGWPIVAAFNRAGAKVGQDIGRLAGLGIDYGVVVQDCDTTSFAGLQADAAIVTMFDAMQYNNAAHERLLGAGLNVVCHGAESYYPQMANPELAARIDALARANNVSFVGTGVWDMSRIWAALTCAGACDEITAIHNHSLTLADPFGVNVLTMMGIGQTLEWFEENFVKQKKGTGFGGHIYRLGPALVLNALGLTVTGVTNRQEPYLLDEPCHCATLGRELPAGSIGGMRAFTEISTREGVTATNSVETRIRLAPEEVEYTQWEITGGSLSPKVRIDRDDGNLLHGLSVINRVKDAIEAPPGIRLMTQLGPMKYPAVR